MVNEIAVNEIAGWIAPAATIIAAMMTAANKGARLTGWGFVVFTAGSVCWVLVGLTTHQTNLLVSNGFLTLINLVGCWRWLGRQQPIEDGGKAAKSASRRSSAPTLFTATSLADLPVVENDQSAVGKTVEALIECSTGTISYVVIATTVSTGLGETLRAVPRQSVTIRSDKIVLGMQRSAFDALHPLEPGDWPPAVS